MINSNFYRIGKKRGGLLVRQLIIFISAFLFLLKFVNSLTKQINTSGPEVIKLFSCSTQLSMKFSPLVNVKMPTIVGILTCMSGKNSNLRSSEPEKC